MDSLNTVSFSHKISRTNHYEKKCLTLLTQPVFSSGSFISVGLSCHLSSLEAEIQAVIMFFLSTGA